MQVPKRQRSHVAQLSFFPQRHCIRQQQHGHHPVVLMLPLLIAPSAIKQKNAKNSLLYMHFHDQGPCLIHRASAEAEQSTLLSELELILAKIRPMSELR
jgi:hypothetical protein